MSRMEIVECTAVEIVEPADELDLMTFCRICRLETDSVVELVEEGVLEVTGASPAQWRFTGAAVRLGRTAARLRHELNLDTAALGIVLELLEQRSELRRQLAMLRGLLGERE